MYNSTLIFGRQVSKEEEEGLNAYGMHKPDKSAKDIKSWWILLKMLKNDKEEKEALQAKTPPNSTNQTPFRSWAFSDPNLGQSLDNESVVA